MRRILICATLLVTICILFIYSRINTKKVDSTSLIEVPVYNGSNIIKHYKSKDGRIDSVVYKIQGNFPATNIIDYYNAELNKLQFSLTGELDKTKSIEKWQFYDDATIKGNPFVARKIIEWVSNTKTTKAILILTYYWINRNPSDNLEKNNDLNVEFEVRPF